MKVVKNVSFALMCSFFLFCVPSAARDTLHCGVNVFPPWKMIDNGKFQGPEIEFVKEIAKRLGIPVRFSEDPLTRCLKAMKDGDLDIMTGLLKNAEREEYIHFIDPLYKTKSNKVFYVLKGKKPL